MTVALQKAKIISGAGPTLTSGGSLGRFGDCSKELVLSVEQVKAWRPLVEQVWGEFPRKNQNFPIMDISWVVTRWQSTLQYTVRGKPCVGPCGQQGERYWWCR